MSRSKNVYSAFMGMDLQGDPCIYVRRGPEDDETGEKTKYLGEAAMERIAHDLEDRLNTPPRPTPAKIRKALDKLHRFVADEEERRNGSGLPARHPYMREVATALRNIERLREALT